MIVNLPIGKVDYGIYREFEKIAKGNGVCLNQALLDAWSAWSYIYDRSLKRTYYFNKGTDEFLLVKLVMDYSRALEYSSFKDLTLDVEFIDGCKKAKTHCDEKFKNKTFARYTEMSMILFVVLVFFTRSGYVLNYSLAVSGVRTISHNIVKKYSVKELEAVG